MIAVTTSGPLFQGTLDVRRGQRLGLERATTRAADLARSYLRPFTRYSTPQYGHVADSVVTKIAPLPGSADQAIGTAYVGKQAGFIGRFLELGTVAHFISPRQRRRRGRGATRALAFRSGGAVRFAAYAHHPGQRARRWAAQSQAAINREAPAIFEQAMAEAFKA